MKITIIGASAGVGLLAVQQALARGHAVTALARSPIPLPDHPQLTKVTGSATSVADLKNVLAGAEAVLVTVGTKKKNATPLFTDTGTALLQAAAELNLTAPVLLITGFGAGASGRYLNWLMQLVVRRLLKTEYEDKTRLEELLAHSSLRWEIVRPGRLTNGPRMPAYQVLPQLYEGIKVSSIARANVADFLLREAENPTLLYQCPALTE